MYHEDWLIRQIHAMVQAIAKIVFNKESIEYDIIDETTQTDMLYIRLTELLAELKINEAENLLFDTIDTQNQNHLLIAADFYNRLNKLDDQTLENCGFSRAEIESGLREIKSMFGIMF